MVVSKNLSDPPIRGSADYSDIATQMYQYAYLYYLSTKNLVPLLYIDECTLYSNYVYVNEAKIPCSYHKAKIAKHASTTGW